MERRHKSERRGDKPPSKRKTGSGIKAMIACSDLGSIIAAAKNWQAYQTSQGKDATKLLHHIANAEAVYIKFNRRCENAFKRREERRRLEAEAKVEDGGLTEVDLPPMVDSVKFDEANKKSIWGKIGDALRPTKW